MFLSAGGSSVNASDYDITTYVNDVTKQNKQVLMEYGENCNVTEEYYYGLQREIYKHDNDNEYYMYDGRGSVANLTTSTGAMKIAYSYDTFGEATITPAQGVTGTSNVFDYNAEATDYNTGFQYLRSRYYNPATANFITQDTYKGNLSNPQTQNRYAYTGNNPVNRKDPSGKSWVGSLLQEVSGYAFKGIGNIIKDAYYSVNSLTFSDWHGIIKQSILDSLFVPKSSDSKGLAVAKNIAGAIYYELDYFVDESKHEFNQALKKEIREVVKDASITVLKKTGKYALKETIKYIAPKVLNIAKNTALQMGKYLLENAKIAYYDLKAKAICSAYEFINEVKYWIKAQAEQFIKEEIEKTIYAAQYLAQKAARRTAEKLKQRITRAIPEMVRNGVRNAIGIGQDIDNWVHRINQNTTNYLNALTRQFSHHNKGTSNNSSITRGKTTHYGGGFYLGKPSENEILFYLQKDEYYKKTNGVVKNAAGHVGYFNGSLNGKGSFGTKNGANVFLGASGKASVFYGYALLGTDNSSVGISADLLTANASVGLKEGKMGNSYDLGLNAEAEASVFKISANSTINLGKVHISLTPYVSLLSVGAKFNYGFFQNGFSFESSFSNGIGKGVSVNVYWK